MKTHNALKVLLAILFASFFMTAKADVELSLPAKAVATTSINKKADEERAQQLMKRLEEIKTMDPDKLSRTEKSQLRKEVRSIKKELASISGGVYLSVGAIIIIILLLILLL